MAQFDFYKYVTKTKATIASKLSSPKKKGLIKESIYDVDRYKISPKAKDVLGKIGDFIVLDSSDSKKEEVMSLIKGLSPIELKQINKILNTQISSQEWAWDQDNIDLANSLGLQITAPPSAGSGDSSDDDAEREKILDVVQDNYGISDAVQEFLGWSEEEAENSDGTNWDDVVDAIMDDPDLKAQFLDSDEDLTEEEDEFNTPEEKEPTAKDVKSAGKGVAGEYQKRLKLDQLVKQKNALVQKLKDGHITIDQYKKMIGTIPQQIKTLTADLAAAATSTDDEEEESL